MNMIVEAPVTLHRPVKSAPATAPRWSVATCKPCWTCLSLS
ncbi:hypothetical protein Y695_03836 [Hydrogenophaga sp. T4]|nr:hypothetical protein Y695_03836 [Hydrogenophaga sp. T4]